jgi:hypothetical protein
MVLANDWEQGYNDMTREEHELLNDIHYYQECLAKIGQPVNDYEKMMYPVYRNLLHKCRKQLTACTYSRMYPEHQ